MAIFNCSSGAAKQSSGNSTTIITEGSSIKGEMKLGCDLYVDGLFEGMIRSDKLITVGKNGRIKGDVHATRLVVQGLVDGIVEAECVEIKASRRVHGSVTSAELAIEAKGVFEGDSRIKNAEKLSTSEENRTKVKAEVS